MVQTLKLGVYDKAVFGYCILFLVHEFELSLCAVDCWIEKLMSSLMHFTKIVSQLFAISIAAVFHIV